jgi:hypothetical protein
MTLANFRLPKRSRLKLIMSKAKVPPKSRRVIKLQWLNIMLLMVASLIFGYKYDYLREYRLLFCGCDFRSG